MNCRLIHNSDLISFFIAFSVLFPLPVSRADQAVGNVSSNHSVEQQLAAVAPQWSRAGRLLLEVNLYSQVPDQSRPSPSAGIDTSTVSGVAAANGLQCQWFGNVLAVAPISERVINTDPALLQIPLERLAAIRPLQFLLASLSQQQFTALGSTGLGIDDLDGIQQQLFRELLPDPLELAPVDAVEPVYCGNNSAATVSQMSAIKSAYDRMTTVAPLDELIGMIRLHGYVHQSLVVQDSRSNRSVSSDDGPYGYVGAESTGSKKLTLRDDLLGDASPEIADGFSNLLVSQEPNVVKEGSLDWLGPEYTVKLSVVGFKTVDDVVSALARTVGKELYVDPSLGRDPVYIAGDTSSTYPVSEIARALTLCLRGVWRQVGSAYLLTDSMDGLGSCQQFIRDVLSSWKNRLNDSSEETGTHLYQLGWPSAMTGFPSSVSSPPSHELLSSADLSTLVARDGRWHGTVQWKDLSIAAQASLMSIMSAQDHLEDPSAMPMSSTITPATPVFYRLSLQTALELPGTGTMTFVRTDIDDSRIKPLNSSVLASEVRLSESVRAALCIAKSSDEAKKVVDLLPTLGLNTLLLDVFYSGHSYFPNTSIPPIADAIGALGGAIKEAALKHLNVFAVVDLCCWNKNNASDAEYVGLPGFDSDLNIYGEPSDVGASRRTSADVVATPATLRQRIFDDESLGESWVSPLDPVVRRTLPELVRTLAATPGIAGLVFEDTAPPGYDGVTNIDEGDFDSSRLDLGYSVGSRLSYLHANHIDPIDVGVSSVNLTDLANAKWSASQFNTAIPGFAEDTTGRSAAWLDYRKDADLSLLRACYGAAKSVAPNLPLLMRERLVGDTIDPWSDPSAVNQSSEPVGSSSFYQYVGPSSFFVIPAGAIMAKYQVSTARMMNDYRSAIGSQVPAGVIVDLINDCSAVDVLGQLSGLANLLAKQPK